MINNRYPVYRITKKDLFRAGKILRDDYNTLPSTEWNNAYDLLGKWRVMHAYPLNTFQANIRSVLKRLHLDSKAIIAQRLKRLPSILSKLNRFPYMRKERMQDIGGIRIILPSIDDVYNVSNFLKSLKWKHVLCREKDYIKEPQNSGYRSIHLIYKYNNAQAPSEFQGLYVEIQIRTRLQHVWATAVETIGTFIEHSLKSSQGPQEWLDYLKLASVVLAIEEGTQVPSGFKTNASFLVQQLHAQTINLNAFSMLDTFHRAVRFNEARKFKNKYILLQLDVANNIGFAWTFNQNELAKANNAYGQFEKERIRNRDAVLVSSSSLSDLRKAYPNYFNDASSFIKQLSKIFKKYNLPEISIPNTYSGDK